MEWHANALPAFLGEYFSKGRERRIGRRREVVGYQLPTEVTASDEMQKHKHYLYPNYI